MMAKEAFLSALKVALTNEMREREFYLKNAERTKNLLGRTMFQQIADEELEHFEKLKALHERWQAEGKWPETVPIEVEGTRVKDVLKEALQKIDQVVQTDEDELEAIRKAMVFEAKGVSYYRKLRDKTTDPKVKNFFGLLAALEHEHYLSLKETEKYLTNPVSWDTEA
jgi:rubrerythrin